MTIVEIVLFTRFCLLLFICLYSGEILFVKTMTKGKKRYFRALRKAREDEEKMPTKKVEEKTVNRVNSIFKSDEIQEISSVLRLEDVCDQHCFLGAIVIGRFDIVKKLLKEGQNIDALDENRETALMHAVKLMRLDMVSFLINRGADITLTDMQGDSAIMLAAQSNLWDQDTFAGLWTSVRDHPRLRIDQSNRKGYTLLHYVTKRQWQSVLEMLLTSPITVDAATNKGVTALTMAASRGDHTMVHQLLQAGADFSIEDLQKCTALCYSIAFSLQKNVRESNRSLELLLAAVNHENSKLPLEQYLARRLQVIVCPPRGQSYFAKTVHGVIVHVLVFFARFIYSGFELLMELNVFQKLKEAVEKNIEDVAYVQAVLHVVLELVKFCKCCCQGLSQLELAEAFFAANLGKCYLDLLHKHETSTGVIKGVFTSLIYICTSDSYSARVWLETNYETVQHAYNKYMRSFPSILMDTKNDAHLEIEKRCLLSFQNLMKTLKTEGVIVTKEEHSKAAAKLKEQMTLTHSMYQIMNLNLHNPFRIASNGKLNLNTVKRKRAKPTAIYNPIIQYNFGKLDIVQQNITCPERNKASASSEDVNSKVETLQREDSDEMKVTADELSGNCNEIKPEKEAKTSNPLRRERKSRIAIKEVQLLADNFSDDSLSKRKSDSKNDGEQRNQTNPKTGKEIVESKQNSPARKFAEGYELFKMEEETDDISIKNVCDWLDSYWTDDGRKAVSDDELSQTLKNLEEIFNRIVEHYDSTWKQQLEDGYSGATGTSEELQKLTSILPELEGYHMTKLINKWEEFCKQIKDHARNNHIVYAAMVSEMQILLMDYETNLKKKSEDADKDDRSSTVSYLDIEDVLNHRYYTGVDLLSDGKPLEFLINRQAIPDLDTDRADRPGVCSTQPSNELMDVCSESHKSDNYLSESLWDLVTKEMGSEHSDGKAVVEDCEIVKSITQTIIEIKENLGNDVETCNNVDDNNDKESSDNKVQPNANITTKHILDELKEIQKSIAVDNSSSFETLKYDFSNSTRLAPKSIIGEFKEPLLGISTSTDAEVLRTPVHSKACEPSTKKLLGKKDELDFCGTQYLTLCLELQTLPACQTQLIDGGNVRLASLEFHLNFKLFNGFNFGDVELGLTSGGMPLVVRRMEKLDSKCNREVCRNLKKSVSKLLSLEDANILPYMACCDTPQAVVFAQPLCVQDMGQYVRQIRQKLAGNRNSLPTIVAHMTGLVQQMMMGLHFLHTRQVPVVHGNLKPSNVMIDSSGSVRLAEFGLHEALYRLKTPAKCSTIWWATETLLAYFSPHKYYLCNQQTDIQSAGMMMHFMLSVGQHAYGQELKEILNNIWYGAIHNRLDNVIASDLVYWMLSGHTRSRPSTREVLKHVLFWSKQKRWEFMKTCCGKSVEQDKTALPLDKMYQDLDVVGGVKEINTKWISVMKGEFEGWFCESFTDTPSGLLQFLAENTEKFEAIKEELLDIFSILPLNLYRLVEQTEWIRHPQFDRFTKVESSLTFPDV